MKKTPEGWPRISSALFYDDAAKAITWLCKAFDFEVRLLIEGEGGRIEHSELTYGDGLIMVGSTGGRADRKVPLPCKSPRSVGGANTQALCICVARALPRRSISTSACAAASASADRMPRAASARHSPRDREMESSSGP